MGALWCDDLARLKELAQAKRAAGKKGVAKVPMLQGSLEQAEKLLRDATNKKEHHKASDIDGEHNDRIMHVWQLV